MGPDQDPRDAKRVTGASNQLSNLALLVLYMSRAPRALPPRPSTARALGHGSHISTCAQGFGKAHAHTLSTQSQPQR
eukprot:6215275-Prymnesium_polylepis.1